LRTSASTPSVVEAEAIDHGLALRQAEHARLRVAGLRPGRDRADLDEAEAERGQRVDVRRVLVEPGGEPDRIREVDAEYARRQGLRPARQQRVQAGAISQFDRAQAGTVRGFGVQREQEGAGEGIKGHGGIRLG
jgi:hypothetical protein